jgi:hypothetical protein
VKQRFDYRWPSGRDEWLAILAIDIAEVAARNGLSVETWEEAGLGAAEGFACELDSGIVVRLVTLTDGDPGSAHVSADSEVVAGREAQPIIGEIIQELSVPEQAVTWLRP